VQVGVRPRENQSAPRTAQRFVRRGGDDIGEGHGIGIQAGGYQARHVRHVHEQVGADRIGNGPEARPIDDARIGREPRDDHLGTMFLSQTLDLIVVNDAGVGDNSVLNRLEEFAREIDLGSMRQMTTVVETHPQNRVAGI